MIYLFCGLLYIAGKTSSSILYFLPPLARGRIELKVKNQKSKVQIKTQKLAKEYFGHYDLDI